MHKFKKTQKIDNKGDLFRKRMKIFKFKQNPILFFFSSCFA
jgi:hypothetical protein